MNEIKKCSIAGVSFTLENDAYDVLSTYIESLKETYKDDPLFPIQASIVSSVSAL